MLNTNKPNVVVLLDHVAVINRQLFNSTHHRPISPERSTVHHRRRIRVAEQRHHVRIVRVRSNRTRQELSRCRIRRRRTDRRRPVTEEQVVNIVVCQRSRRRSRVIPRKLQLENRRLSRRRKRRQVDIKTVPLSTNDVQNNTRLAVTYQRQLGRTSSLRPQVDVHARLTRHIRRRDLHPLVVTVTTSVLDMDHRTRQRVRYRRTRT